MKETKEEYLNFDGMASEVPNDMPWGDTHWSNLKGTEWQQEGYAGTVWQDVNLNASGGNMEGLPGMTGKYAYGPETITLGHHQNLSPNMSLVLSDDDNSRMPDSDEWSNHPGFLGGTWWKDLWQPGEAEKERAEEARRSIEAKYPVTGSCDLLTGVSEQIKKAIAGHGGASKRGAKRVAKRSIPILKKKLSTVNANRDIQCASEDEDRMRDDQLNLLMQQQMQQPEEKKGVSAGNVIIGLVLIGGLIWGISRLAKPRGTAPVAPVAAPAVK